MENRAILLMLILCGIIIVILVFGAILKMYDISDSLKNQNVLLKLFLEEKQKENKMIETLLQHINATEDNENVRE